MLYYYEIPIIEIHNQNMSIRQHLINNCLQVLAINEAGTHHLCSVQYLCEYDPTKVCIMKINESVNYLGTECPPIRRGRY